MKKTPFLAFLTDFLCLEEATTRLELVMRVLQTLALPTWPRRRDVVFRAGNGIRTRDLLLGKETFYQLNHARITICCL